MNCGRVLGVYDGRLIEYDPSTLSDGCTNDRFTSTVTTSGDHIPLVQHRFQSGRHTGAAGPSGRPGRARRQACGSGVVLGRGELRGFSGRGSRGGRLRGTFAADLPRTLVSATCRRCDRTQAFCLASCCRYEFTIAVLPYISTPHLHHVSSGGSRRGRGRAGGAPGRRS